MHDTVRNTVEASSLGLEVVAGVLDQLVIIGGDAVEAQVALGRDEGVVLAVLVLPRGGCGAWNGWAWNGVRFGWVARAEHDELPSSRVADLCEKIEKVI